MCIVFPYLFHRDPDGNDHQWCTKAKQREPGDAFVTVAHHGEQVKRYLWDQQGDHHAINGSSVDVLVDRGRGMGEEYVVSIDKVLQTQVDQA